MTIPEGIKLEPCPFCGFHPSKRAWGGDERDGYAQHVSYVCKGCGCARGACGDYSKGGYADNSKVEAEAIKAWNTRASVPPQADAEPVAHQFQDRYGDWCMFMNERHYRATLEDGTWPIRDLYTHPDSGELSRLRTENEELRAKSIVTYDLDAAAKKLAACMDYLWDYMPEQGRNSMREHAKAVIDAATASPATINQQGEGEL